MATDSDTRNERRRTHALVGIKLLHTVAWAFFAGCILAIPLLGAVHNFRATAILSSIVLLECAILAVNRGRCPFTDLAARYTEERRENFDIYLPAVVSQAQQIHFWNDLSAERIARAGDAVALARVSLFAWNDKRQTTVSAGRVHGFRWE